MRVDMYVGDCEVFVLVCMMAFCVCMCVDME